MARVQRILLILSVALMLLGASGFVVAFTHLPRRIVTTGGCGSGYPNPPCYDGDKPKTKQVPVWNNTVVAPIIVGTVGLVLFYDRAIRSRLPRP